MTPKPGTPEREKQQKIMVAILDRAQKIGMRRDTAMMDLYACNERTPLDFERLLSFPAFDFSHDIYGINRHLDRDTYKLNDFFLPRCAKPRKAVARG